METKERLVELPHKGRFGGAEISYRALAGELLLYDEAEKPKALMFYVAYLDGEAAPRSRLILRGSNLRSSMWRKLQNHNQCM